MKPKLLFPLLLLLALLAAAFPPPARADEEVSFDYFYKNLQPYGEWIDAGGDYGLVWHPTGVDEDWSPYTDGYWAYTDSGWTWVSYEDFGGITYHYGRWVKLEDEGWCWVPDYDWGPAWVSWRHSDDYVGWAPLPPEAHYRPDVGISTWVDTSYDIGPGSYRFCPVVDFGAPVIREVLLPRERNVVIIRNTVNITNITVAPGGLPFLGGPRLDFISARVRRPIPTLKLVRETNITNITNITNTTVRGAPVISSVQRGNTLVVAAPVMRRPQNFEAIRAQYKPAKVLPTVKPTHGWEMVKAPEERQALKAEFTKQDKGATAQSAPARKFSEAEVASVPKTADPTAQVPVKGRVREGGPAVAGATPAVPGGFVKPGERRPGAPGATEERPAMTPPTATPAIVGKGKNKVVPGALATPAEVPGTEPRRRRGEAGATPAGPAVEERTPIKPGGAATPRGGFVAPGEPRATETPGVPATEMPKSRTPDTERAPLKGATETPRGGFVAPGGEVPRNPATEVPRERTRTPDTEAAPIKHGATATPRGGFVAPGGDVPRNPATEVPRERTRTPDTERPRVPATDVPRPPATEVQRPRQIPPQQAPNGVHPPGVNPNATPVGKGKGKDKNPDSGMIENNAPAGRIATRPEGSDARARANSEAQQEAQQQAQARAAAEARSNAAAAQARQAAQARANAEAMQAREAAQARAGAQAQQQQQQQQQARAAQARAAAVAQQQAREGAMARRSEDEQATVIRGGQRPPVAQQAPPAAGGGRRLTKEQLDALKRQQQLQGQ